MFYGLCKRLVLRRLEKRGEKVSRFEGRNFRARKQKRFWWFGLFQYLCDRYIGVRATPKTKRHLSSKWMSVFLLQPNRGEKENRNNLRRPIRPRSSAPLADILDESVSLLSLGRNLANFKCTGIGNYHSSPCLVYRALRTVSIRVWRIVYLCTALREPLPR